MVDNPIAINELIDESVENPSIALDELFKVLNLLLLFTNEGICPRRIKVMDVLSKKLDVNFLEIVLFLFTAGSHSFSTTS